MNDFIETPYNYDNWFIYYYIVILIDNLLSNLFFVYRNRKEINIKDIIDSMT